MCKEGGMKCAAALSLREREACYAELMPLDDGWRLVGAQTFTLPSGCISGGHIVNGDLLGRFLREQLQFCWKKLPLVIGIPTMECFYQILRLPTADVEEAREAVRWDFSRYFPFSYEDALFDVCDANLPLPPTAGMAAIAVAALKKELLPVYTALQNSSSRVAALEPIGVACARAVLPPSVYDSGGSSLLTVQCGESVQFALVNDGTGLMFRSVSFDDRSVTRTQALNTVREEFLKTREYVQNRFFCTPGLLVAGSDDLFETVCVAAPAEAVKRAGISELHCLEPETASDDCVDVAGLLLRFADEDRV